MDVDAREVARRLRDEVPEVVREHGVWVEGVLFPVKQAFEAGCGVPRGQFTSHTARRHLKALGFDILNGAGVPDGRLAASTDARADRPAPVVRVASEWPWEGSVQGLFAVFLRQHGWTVTSMADTASKARGVDLLGHKGPRHLGAEVKGWPSDDYADPRRVAEVKRTRPSTQAGHWFSQAMFKAIMLLDTHPGHESLMVLPDFPRYRDLAVRTRTGRELTMIHVVLVDREGQIATETWSP
ncbi:hypothetical protein Lfu02_76290 [Longispora fulva]|nr:hypothetical protein Lfu02_76290 [Longispora fulva]